MVADAATARELGELKARLVMLEQASKDRRKQLDEMRREQAEQLAAMRKDLGGKIEDLAGVLKMAKGAAWLGGLLWVGILGVVALVVSYTKGNH